MQRQGLTQLTETQIKSWWSTYHQKKKRQMQNLVDEAQHLRQMCSSVNETWSSAPFTVRLAVPLPSPSVQAPNSVPKALCTPAASCVTTSTTAAQTLISVPMATCTSASPCVTRATTAVQTPLSVPMGTCSSAAPRAAASTTATKAPLSVPMALCTPIAPCVTTAPTAAQDPLSVPMAMFTLAALSAATPTAAQASVGIPVVPNSIHTVYTQTTVAHGYDFSADELLFLLNTLDFFKRH